MATRQRTDSKAPELPERHERQEHVEAPEPPARPEPGSSEDQKRLSTPKAAALLFIICVVVALVMVFGNKIIWITEKQAHDEEALKNPVTISSVETSTANTDVDRIPNLKLCADTLDGTVIEPGSVFSFNSVVGETTKERGYKDAVTITGDPDSFVTGGGADQVATSVYIAALEAGLEIPERHPHAKMPDYCDSGLDANVVYGEADLKIRNTRDTSVILHVIAEGQTVIASFEGVGLEDGVTIKAMSSKIDERTDENDDGEKVKSVRVESFRVYYEDDTEKARESIAIDYYVIG